MQLSIFKALQNWISGQPSVLANITGTQTLIPENIITLQKDLAGGYSEAKVLLVDIHASMNTASANNIEQGQYIFKVERDNQEVNWSAEPKEARRHETAYAHNTAFAERHIPRLVRHGSFDGNTVLLYEVAAEGIAFAVTADSLCNTSTSALDTLVGDLAWRLLAEFNTDYRYESTATAWDVLRLWLGYRLNTADPNLRLNRVATSVSGADSHFIVRTFA